MIVDEMIVNEMIVNEAIVDEIIFNEMNFQRNKLSMKQTFNEMIVNDCRRNESDPFVSLLFIPVTLNNKIIFLFELCSAIFIISPS